MTAVGGRVCWDWAQGFDHVRQTFHHWATPALHTQEVNSIMLYGSKLFEFLLWVSLCSPSQSLVYDPLVSTSCMQWLQVCTTMTLSNLMNIELFLRTNSSASPCHPDSILQTTCLASSSRVGVRLPLGFPGWTQYLWYGDVCCHPGFPSMPLTHPKGAREGREQATAVFSHLSDPRIFCFLRST